MGCLLKEAIMTTNHIPVILVLLLFGSFLAPALGQDASAMAAPAQLLITHTRIFNGKSDQLAWGTDFLFNPAQNKNQNSDILKLKAWFTPVEMLKLMTHDNAQLLVLSGPRNPYPGKLGVIEEGAYADMLVVDGNPIANIELLEDPEKNFVVIIKDEKIFKNSLK